MNIFKAKRLPRKKKKALMREQPIIYINWKCRKQIRDIVEPQERSALLSFLTVKGI